MFSALTDESACSIVEMLFCTSLVALVGAGDRPGSSTRKLQIVNTKVSIIYMAYTAIVSNEAVLACYLPITVPPRIPYGTRLPFLDNPLKTAAIYYLRAELSYVCSVCKTEPEKTRCRA